MPPRSGPLRLDMKDTSCSTMKQPDSATERVEFNLGKAPNLRCVSAVAQMTVCGSCEACGLVKQLSTVRDWFKRTGDQSRRRFLLGLVRRLNSVDLIQYITRLLQPLLCKDYMYARARTNPSLATDRATMSGDRALGVNDLEVNIAETWHWFQHANYWSKSNFLLALMQDCESHLLHLIGVQAKTLLASEEKAFHAKSDYETSSIAESTYTFRSEEHPEVDLLSTVCSAYSRVTADPFTTEPNTAWSRRTTPKTDRESLYYDDETINEDSGDESLGDDDGSVDPTCMVIPMSAKAYSGVAKYMDFIRCLPVNLSKMILGFLDQVSLHNCVCVSKHWRILAEEVHREFYVDQQVREEIMLMQGAAAQGCNPVYAKDMDVAVPNLLPNSWEAVRVGEEIQTTFKSEVSFRTAYSGFSTRNIIMEERNVYCGAYNVMVLLELCDANRVVHTDGGKLIAIGSQDRKVRFVNSETGQAQGPQVSGHAGSIRCVALAEKRKFVLSGSYDTSIRKWCLETGKCAKIYRGHRDTVLCLKIVGEKMVSGGKDCMCKVWQLESGKCTRTFKHKKPVTAVALADEPALCVSGCEAGLVKVWDMRSGELIKKLQGHHGPVMGVKFDRWHIVSGSKDGYALVWSSQGNHARCLTALRHPSQVLCLELAYLRVITGSVDGKLRIWNMITAQCLRIMRGNSRSDPILHLTAIDNRITINTANNLLVLNFEPIEYDYTLENDEMPPLVQYSKYSDAPVRQQPYAYIRAQRMKKAGATNTKIVHHDRAKEQDPVYYTEARKPDQIAHSAKGLSCRSMENARRIQSAVARLESNAGQQMFRGPQEHSAGGDGRSAAQPHSKVTTAAGRTHQSAKCVSVSGKPPAAPCKGMSGKARGASSKSGTHSVVSVGGFKAGQLEEDSDVTEGDTGERRRRVSWAFQQPSIPKTKDLSLAETKALLRSQMRAKGEVVPPDFIYLSVNSIQATMRPTEASKNMEVNHRQQELQLSRKLGRPSSSPGRVDPRTKMPIEELHFDQFLLEQGIAPRDLDLKSQAADSKLSLGTTHVSKPASGTNSRGVPTETVIVTEFAPKSIGAKPHLSLHSGRVRSSIPKPQMLRPHTAVVRRSPVPPSAGVESTRRAQSAVECSRVNAARTATGDAASPPSGTSPLHQPRVKHQKYSTSATETSAVPMLMYSKDLKAKLEELKQHRLSRQAESSARVSSDPNIGRVSDYNDPMRRHVDFRLLTHEQIQQKLHEVSTGHTMDQQQRQKAADKRQRSAWLAKVKGLTDKDFAKRPQSVAPEIREYGEVQSLS